MKLLINISLASLLAVLVLVAPVASAATSPGLGAAGTFVILSDTYTNTATSTTLNGDLGYTTPPAVNPTVNGNTHAADNKYNQAGIDQGTALSNLNSQPCTFNFAPGNIDLASDTAHGQVGVYSPGVYCITGAASIGGGGTITLDGPGTYIFRMDGALTTSANSKVVLANGASACNVWWTPTQATTLGANSTFAGIDIDAAGITIGDSVNWTGRALAFGGTVSTTRDTITAPSCSTASPDDNSAGGGGNTSGPTVPGLPNTGSQSMASGVLLSIIAIASICAIATLRVLRKKIN